MKFNKSKVVLFMALCCFFCMSWSDTEIYIIEFGILEESESGIFLAKKTKKIPLITKKKGQIFGFKISPPHSGKYTYHTVSTLPMVSKVINESNLYNSKNNVRIIRSRKYSVMGIRFNGIWFDSNDVVGKYKIDLFINDKLRETVEFEVFKPFYPSKGLDSIDN